MSEGAMPCICDDDVDSGGGGFWWRGSMVVYSQLPYLSDLNFQKYFIASIICKIKFKKYC